MGDVAIKARRLWWAGFIRGLLVGAALVLVVLALSACTPAPDTRPLPPPMCQVWDGDTIREIPCVKDVPVSSPSQFDYWNEREMP